MATIIGYTKAKLDELFGTKVPTTRQVAGHALSADVTISKSDVGLSDADNTSDEDKPISDDTAAALAALMPVFVLAVADPDPTTGDPAGLYFRRSS